MPSIVVSFVAAKRSFSRRFAESRRHTYSYLRNFDRSWSSRRCFGRRLRDVWAISGSHYLPRSRRRRSVSCDRVNVNKPKLRNFERPLGLLGQLLLPSNAEQQSRSRYVNRRKSGRYTRYLQNFDGPLGCLVVTGNVFDVGNVSSLRKTMARVRDNFRCRQSWSMSPLSPFRNFAENPQFCTFISPSIMCSSISHFALYQLPPPEEPARRTSHWHLQP